MLSVQDSEYYRDKTNFIGVSMFEWKCVDSVHIQLRLPLYLFPHTDEVYTEINCS